MIRQTRSAAFTIAEVVVAAGVGAVMLTGLLVASLTFQRGFLAAEHQITCQEDQLRVTDYLTRDLRAAVPSSIKIENQNRKITCSIPRPARNATTLLIETPTLPNGVVQYGTVQTTVSYYLEGADFVRQEGTAKTVLSTRIEEFFIPAPEENPPAVLTFRLSFTPRYSRRTNAQAPPAGVVTSTVWIRNTSQVK
jgi:hypothetical protein